MFLISATVTFLNEHAMELTYLLGKNATDLCHHMLFDQMSLNELTYVFAM